MGEEQEKSTRMWQLKKKLVILGMWKFLSQTDSLAQIHTMATFCKEHNFSINLKNIEKNLTYFFFQNIK